MSVNCVRGFFLPFGSYSFGCGGFAVWLLSPRSGPSSQLRSCFEFRFFPRLEHGLTSVFDPGRVAVGGQRFKIRI